MASQHKDRFTTLRSAGTVAVIIMISATVGVLAQIADTPASVSPVTPDAFEAIELVQRYQGTITASDLASHLYVFSSDYFEGRETTTRGQKLAAYYLAGQYRKMGLRPAGTASPEDTLAPEAYFQPFPVYGRRLREARLEVAVDGRNVASTSFKPGTDFSEAILAFGTVPDVEAGVVFAGYGIQDPALGFNEYAALDAKGIDVSGKWVLMLPNEPLANDSTSLLPTPDGRPSAQWTIGSSKINTMRSRNPAGFLIVGDAGPAVQMGWIENIRRAARMTPRIGRLSLEPYGEAPAYPPTYIISSRLANRILEPSGRTVEDLMQEINANLEPVVFEVADATVRSAIDYPRTPLETENVVALIEGSDPALKDEVVVITSHYDHVGIDPRIDGDGIFNGADDNASGTVATLEIAEAFMKAKMDGFGPRRSILFLNVSGEEKGLLGSSYYTDIEPIFPLKKTVANLNLDMVGRIDPSRESANEHYVYIIGSNLVSQELHEINVRINELTGIRLELDERYNRRDDPEQLYARSDQWNFGKNGIPFIFFFTGLHEDYHGPDDEAHKIEYERMAAISRLVFGTAWQLANQDSAPSATGTF